MKKFSQHWRWSETLARHAWRWYLNRPDVTVNQMTRASHEAWIACNTVYNRLRASEREILQLYFHTGNDPSEAAETLRKWAHDNGTEVWRMMRVIKAAYRMWAIERGLADEEEGQEADE